MSSTSEQSPAHLTRFQLELPATYDRKLLAQLPAVLLHDSYFRVHGIQPWTPVHVQLEDRSADAWLVPMERSRLARRRDASWSASGWVSADLATMLGMSKGQTATITVSTRYTIERVTFAKINNYITSDEIAMEGSLKATLGRRVVVSSGSRVAVMRTVEHRSRPDDDKDTSVRLNFHMRRTLNIVPDPSTRTQHVQLSSYQRFRKRRTGWGTARLVLRSPLDALVLGLELIGRVLLQAPRVTLACAESMTNDDSHGVARVSESAAELLGLTPGDSAYFYWGRNRIRLRVLLVNDERPNGKPEQSVVDWTPDVERPAADPESIVSIPAKARSILGVPRSGVVVARRSILSILRRRVIALVLPLVAIAVGVAKLDLQPLVAGLLIGGAVLLTLAGEWIPLRPWRR